MLHFLIWVQSLKYFSVLKQNTVYPLASTHVQRPSGTVICVSLSAHKAHLSASQDSDLRPVNVYKQDVALREGAGGVGRRKRISRRWKRRSGGRG